jgi:hypothetical protein
VAAIPSWGDKGVGKKSKVELEKCSGTTSNEKNSFVRLLKILSFQF